MKKVLPTMSIFGITNDPGVITEKLFMYFITSEYSQSITFYGEISSLKYILNQYGTEPLELKNKIYEALVTLYKKYFPTVDVNVDIVEDPVTKNKKLSINVTTVTEDGVTSTIDEELKVSGSTITNILDLIYR